MNDTVVVQKSLLEELVDVLHEAKAKLSLVSSISMDDVSNDASFGLYLFASNIKDDLNRVEATLEAVCSDEHNKD
ncbi:hypothetical protein LOH54_02440 [Sulfurimonas sp. HSL-3221]|uniref:hypothetical protein n=1 Tax=Sulfurimonadaceae TaxID=2771471 RepID=UPI001E48663C|nr:hypothetical protein [Sulfurimonas sp. HSL-3221]UFS62993.1 hypothetical protein LOH54_02440 [Sulfurimonas sp. HSL-3221]